MKQLIIAAIVISSLSACSAPAKIEEEGPSTDELNIIKLMLFNLERYITKDFLVYEQLEENEISKIYLDRGLTLTDEEFDAQDIAAMSDARPSSVSLSGKGVEILHGGCTLTKSRSGDGEKVVVSFSRPLFSRNGKNAMIHQLLEKGENLEGTIYYIRKNSEMIWEVAGMMPDAVD
jgi:hypothetical protein